MLPDIGSGQIIRRSLLIRLGGLLIGVDDPEFQQLIDMIPPRDRWPDD